jgi:acyl-coenzyme A thioesterase PaaI-like protein
MTTSTAALLEDALREIAGPDAEPASMTVDYGAVTPPVAGQAFTRKAWVERSTRSLIFAQAEARTEDGNLVAAASAVFRRVTQA